MKQICAVFFKPFLFIFLLLLEIQLTRESQITSLTLPDIFDCLKPGPEFDLWLFVWLILVALLAIAV